LWYAVRYESRRATRAARSAGAARPRGSRPPLLPGCSGSSVLHPLEPRWRVRSSVIPRCGVARRNLPTDP
jgi:hypothetical protein